MPLHGFTAVDLGYERGNAVSNIVNRIDEPPFTDDVPLSSSTRSGTTRRSSKTSPTQLCEHIASVYQENSPERIYFLILYNLFSEFLDDISEDVLPNDLHRLPGQPRSGRSSTTSSATPPPASSTSWRPTTAASSPTASASERRSRRWRSSSTTSCATSPSSCSAPKKLADNWTNYNAQPHHQHLRQRPLQLRRALPTPTCSATRGRIARACRSTASTGATTTSSSSTSRTTSATTTTVEERETRYQRLMQPGHPRGREDQGADALGDAGQQPLHRPAEPARARLRGRIGEPQREAQHLDKRSRRSSAGRRRCSTSGRSCPPEERTADAILDALDFDFFELLDSVTIARSRKHIQTFYDTTDIGTFPERLQAALVPLPADRPARTSSASTRSSSSSQLLTLAVYAPLSYVFPSRLREVRGALRHRQADIGQRRTSGRPAASRASRR